MRGSLSELVAMPGMPSEPTLRKMIAEHSEFPVVSRGKNGVAYEFDLVEAANFVRLIRENEELAARARSEEIRQLGLELLGEQAAMDQQRVGLSPTERKVLIEEELLAIKLAKERGELVWKASVESAVGGVLSLLNQRMRSFSARLAKRMEITRDQIAVIDEMMDRDLNEMADRFEEFGRDARNVAEDIAENSGI